MASELREKPGIIATARALNCLPEKKSGSKFVGGCCPKNHGSQGNRCFWIYPATESFYCQNCKHGGDALDLIMYARDCSFPEALSFAEERGLIFANGHRNTAEVRPLYQIITTACQFFHENLPDQHRDHLRKHYGLDDGTIDEHRLGFAPVDEFALVNHLKTKFNLEDIKKTGLLNKWGKSHFQGQLTFPYWHAGLVKYIIGRQTPESPEWKQGKYDKLPVYDEQDRPFISQDIKNTIFYGEDTIKNSDTVYVAEGVTDCLIALQHGLPCISPVTTSFAEKDWPKFISLTKGKRVFLIPDNEVNEAGMKGAEKTKAHLEENGIECAIITLPRPNDAVKIDLNEYVRDNGIEAFLKLVKAQCPCLEDVILTDSQLVTLAIPEKRSYLSPWLNESSIISFVAWRGVGKSLFSWGAIDAITKGQNFGPWQCGDPVNCLILDGEMAVQDGQKRIADFGTAGRKAELLFYSDHYAHSLGLGRANLLNETWRSGMADYMLKRDVKVWVCDNIASLAPGIDENSKSDWDVVSQWLLKLRFSGITTILIHHEGKQGTQRGTSAREDNLDACISLKRPADYTADQGARFIVTFTKSRIPLEYLPLIADHEFQFIRTAGDTYEWTWCSSTTQKKQEILRLSDEGMGVNEIAKTIGVDKGYVSRVRQTAIKDGILSKTGRLTQYGFGRMND